MSVLLSVQNISKTFRQGHKALNDISLDIESGEFIALLGPSGCGKTTLLSTLAGFISPDAGDVYIAGKKITQLSPDKRALNTVFQNYALFPHMTVLKNVMYGPLRAGIQKAEAQDRAHQALDMVGLKAFAERYPAQMSGGQSQRVALARAIVNKPKLLLLDEPLSALDFKLRKRMQRELKELQEKLGITFIFVTHDQEEAMSMADRIVIMNDGVIEQVGSGEHIYKRPDSRFVADFIGDANLLECEGEGPSIRLRCCTSKTTDAERFEYSKIAMVRPEDIIVSREFITSKNISHAATVTDLVGIGSYTTIYLDLNGTRIASRRLGANDLGMSCGDEVYVEFPSDHIHVIGT